MADGFHIDGNGNLWIGSTSNSFDSSANFYVQTDGTLHAESGDVGGLAIGSDFIKSSNYNNTSGSEAGYRLQSDGNAIFHGTLTATNLTATGATITGSVTADSGTIGGISINSGDIQANYSAGSSGFLIESDGDAFFNSVTVNNPIITIGKVPSGTPSAASSTSLKLGDALLFSRDEGSTGNHLFSTKPFVVMADGSEDNPSLTIQGDFQKMGFFLETSNDFNFDSFKASNGNDDIFSFSSSSTDFSVLGDLNLSAALKAGGQSGSSGQVLQSTGSGVQWANAGGSHADSDHTSFADSTHSHNNLYYTETETNNLLNNKANSSHGTHVSYGGNGSSGSVSRSDHSHASSGGVTSISSGGSAMTGAIAVTGSGSGFFDSITQDTQQVKFTRSGVSSVKLRPASSNANYGLGDSTYRWLVLYSQFNTNVSSDEILKENIEITDLGLDFINDLQPKKFTYIRQYEWACSNTEEIVGAEDAECNSCDEDTDCNVVWTDVTGIEEDSISYGLIAQDVEALQPEGTNWNLVKGEGDETKSLAYSELISPLIKAVQELSAKNDELQSRIEELEG